MALQGSSFSYNVNANCMPCSSSNCFKSLRCLWPPLPIPNPCIVVSAKASRGNKTQFFPLSKLPNGRPPPLRQNMHMLPSMPFQTKRDDIEGNLSAESIISDEQTLQRDLQNAIKEENYAEAVKIRVDLRVLHEDNKASVLVANSRFYDAFRRGDLATMLVWMNYEFPLEIELKNVRVLVKGDFGYVTCMEFVKTTKGNNWGAQFVTNVFERINGQWYICIHHASQADL